MKSDSYASMDAGEGPAWRAAAAAGHDMWQLSESMAMTPGERLRQHRLALERITRLEGAMDDARLHEDRLLDALLEHEVEFVVIGGVAAALHGSTLVTRDLDICIPLGAASILKIQSALANLHPRVRAGSSTIPLSLDESRAAGLKNLYVRTDDGQLDCLGEVAGIGSFEAVLALSEPVQLNDRNCHVLGIEGLIRAKKAMGRPRDLEAIQQLTALRDRREPG
jgi:hypothetical protein